MGLIDYVGERCAVYHGGHRFVVRKPTFAAVAFAVALYPKQLAAVARADDATDLSLDDALQVFDLDARALRILRLIVDTDAPENVWPLRDLVVVAVSMMSVDRVRDVLFRSLRQEREEDESTNDVSYDDRIPGKEEIGFTAVASRFGVSPTSMMEWPWEAVVEATEVLNHIDEVREHGEPKAKLHSMLSRFASGEEV